MLPAGLRLQTALMGCGPGQFTEVLFGLLPSTNSINFDQSLDILNNGILQKLTLQSRATSLDEFNEIFDP